MKEGKWGINEEIDTMWEDMVNSIKKVALEVLGEWKEKKGYLVKNT